MRSRLPSRHHATIGIDDLEHLSYDISLSLNERADHLGAIVAGDRSEAAVELLPETKTSVSGNCAGKSSTTPMVASSMKYGISTANCEPSKQWPDTVVARTTGRSLRSPDAC
jgi:hypothetical protein